MGIKLSAKLRVPIAPAAAKKISIYGTCIGTLSLALSTNSTCTLRLTQGGYCPGQCPILWRSEIPNWSCSL